MTNDIRYEASSTVNFFAYIAFLGLVIALATYADFAFTGANSTVILPIAVVGVLGLRAAGTRYAILGDRLRIDTPVGSRDVPFSGIAGYTTGDRGFYALLQSLTTANLGRSAISVTAAKASIWNSPTLLWVRDVESFLAAAESALADWRARHAAHS